MTVLGRLLLLPAAAAALASPAAAATSEWFDHEHGAVRLVSASAAAGTGGTVDLGLQFRMRPGWKIYWRSPGDAGFPPIPDWTESANLASADMAWPAPARFSVLGLETFGYGNEVVFPISAALREPGKGLSVRARLRFLTCDEICVPYETRLALALPPGPDAATPHRALIDEWRAKVPKTGPGGPFSVERVELAGGGAEQALVVRASAAEAFVRPDAVVEGPEGFAFGPPTVRIGDGGTTALMRIPVHPSGTPPASIEGREVTVTLLDGGRAQERRQAVARAAAAPAEGTTDRGAGLGLLAVLGLAIAGGLILNFMPCVLPVLSIKLLAVVGHGGVAPGRVRAGFLASAAGIVACFLALATAVAGLRAAGLAVGWGIQFQQPVFLAFMIVVITLFACNMWGFFEIRLPGPLADAAAGSHGGRGGLAEHFLSGAFATLLATPCTAPFLGTAVSFALTGGLGEIYAVFLALGTGLALPWLAVAAMPGLVNRLPRPGPWMATVKRVLSIALVGTAVWLLAILWPRIGGAAAVMIVVLMAVIAYALRQSSGLSGRARLAGWGIVAALAAISMAGAGSFAERAAPAVAAKDDGPWIAFDEERIPKAVAAGKTMLVDVTADWCLTCQVNKSLVLNRGAVAALVDSGAIVAMRADWTRPDPRIAAYLKRFGRFGIPFNAVYGAAAPEGVALPEILTETSVLEAVSRASGLGPDAGGAGGGPRGRGDRTAGLIYHSIRAAGAPPNPRTRSER